MELELGFQIYNFELLFVHPILQNRMISEQARCCLTSVIVREAMIQCDVTVNPIFLLKWYIGVIYTTLYTFDAEKIKIQGTLRFYDMFMPWKQNNKCLAVERLYIFLTTVYECLHFRNKKNTAYITVCREVVFMWWREKKGREFFFLKIWGFKAVS